MPDTIKYYLIGFVIAFLLLGIFILTLSILYSKKQIKNRNEKQQLQSQFSQTLLQSQLEIQEQTLQHISRELHDNLGQTASLVKIHLNTLNLDDTEKASGKIEEAKELTRQLIGDIKSLSISLNGDRIAQSGLAKAIETEVARLNKTEKFTARFAQEGNITTTDNDKAVILYRMVQEVLNNIVKHSQAKQIDVLLKWQENLITLAASDNGIGFDVNEKLNSGGSGLQNLQKRASLIHAELLVKSTPGNGTSAIIQLPL